MKKNLLSLNSRLKHFVVLYNFVKESKLWEYKHERDY